MRLFFIRGEGLRMRYIGLDLGTTYTKYAVLDLEGLTVAWSAAVVPPMPADISNGRYELDAWEYYGHVKEGLDAALDIAPDALGIVVSAQMHGCVVVDENASPLTGLISWQDAAGLRPIEEVSYVDALARKLERHEDDPEFVRPSRKLALGNLYARVEDGLRFPARAKFCTPGGYIALRLGGGNACHATMAASTGCASMKGNRWFVPSLDAAGIGGLRFPEIVTGYRSIGTYRRNGREYALYPDVGDHQNGVLGSLARAYDDLQVNIGTGGMIGRVVRGFSRVESVETRPLMEDLFVHTVTGLPGGRHVRVVADFVMESARMLGVEVNEDDFWRRAVVLSLEGDAPDVRPDFFLPGGGSIGGIGSETLRPEALLRGMYRAIGGACAAAKERLGGGDNLVYTGGAVTRNAAMRAAIERACGLRGILPHGDGAAAGLMRLALYAQGVSLETSRERLLAASRQNGE